MNKAPLLAGHHMCDVCNKKRSVGNHMKCSKIRQMQLRGSPPSRKAGFQLIEN